MATKSRTFRFSLFSTLAVFSLCAVSHLYGPALVWAQDTINSKKSNYRDYLGLIQTENQTQPSNHVFNLMQSGSNPESLAYRNQNLATLCANPILATSLGSGTNFLAFDGQNNAYISNEGVFDPNTNTYTKTGINKITPSGTISDLDLGGIEPGKIISRKDGTLFSLNISPFNTITRIKVGDSASTINFSSEYQLLNITLDQDENLIIAKIGMSKIWIDKLLNNGQVVNLTSARLGDGEIFLTVDEQNQIYFNSETSSGQPSLHIIDSSNPVNPKIFPINEDSIGSLVVKLGKTYILTQSRNGNHLYSIQNQQLSKLFTINVARSLGKLTLTADNKLLALDYLNDELVEVNQSTGLVQSLTLTSTEATDIGVNSLGEVFFTNYKDGTVRKLDCNNKISTVEVTLDNVTTNTFCNAEMSNNPTNCTFEFTGSTSYAYILPNTTITAFIGQPNSPNQSRACAPLNNQSLYCYGISTSNISKVAEQNIILKIGSTEAVKGKVFLASSFKQFTTDRIGSTNLRPQLESFQSRLWEFVSGTDGKIYFRSTLDGASWSSWQTDPQSRTNIAVTTAVFNNKLYVTSVSPDGRIYLRSTEDGASWSSWQETEGLTFSSVSMTTAFNKLWQSARGSNHKIYTRYSLNGQTWSSWQSDFEGETQRAVALIGFDNIIHQAVRGQDSAIYYRSSTNGTDWSKWSRVAAQSNESPSFGVFKNKLFLTSVGVNGKIYTCFRSEGGWTNWAEYGGVTNHALSNTVWKNRLYQSARGNDGLIYIRFME